MRLSYTYAIASLIVAASAAPLLNTDLLDLKYVKDHFIEMSDTVHVYHFYKNALRRFTLHRFITLISEAYESTSSKFDLY